MTSFTGASRISRRHLSTLQGVSLLALALSVHPAMAQDRTGNRDDIEEIIVSGEAGAGVLNLRESSDVGGRLGLSLLETPGNVELIDSDTLQLRGDFEATDAVTRATGLTSAATPGNGGSAITARGFSGHSSVVTMYDGTRLYVGAGSVTFPADTWTLDRIEIMHGASSVIHGVGAIGAAVNYVPMKPLLGEQSMRGMASFGSHGTWRVGAGGNMPLSDKMALRLDGTYYETNGYVDRADKSRFVLAGSILLQATDTFRATLSMDYADVDDSTYFGTPKIDGELIKANRRLNYNVTDAAVAYEDYWPRLRVEWDLSDNIHLQNDTYYITADRHWRNLESYAYNPDTEQVDRVDYLEILHDQEQYGNRTSLRFDSAIGGMNNRLSIGGEGNKIKFKHSNNSPYTGESSVPVTGFDPGMFVNIPGTTLDYMTDTKQFAAFADDRLEVTDQLSLVAGARYDDVNYSREDVARSNGQPADMFDANFHSFTWRLGAVFEATRNLSFYAQASTAVDPIGSPASISESQAELDPTKGRQYEVGVKQVFWGGQGEWSLSAYSIRKRDILTRDPNNPGESLQIGKQGSDGVEVSLGLRPTTAIAIDFNATMLNARYLDFNVANGDALVSYRGNDPRNVAEETANLWITWLPVQRLRLAGGLRYVGSRYGDDANTQKLPSYAVVDANVRWALTEKVGVMLRVNNVLDNDDYVISQYNEDQWILGEPRTFEASLDFRF